MRFAYALFFFFSSRRRHTRSYGDWSSDVCSSDLVETLVRLLDRAADERLDLAGGGAGVAGLDGQAGVRSEERRVGKECRSRGSPEHLKKREEAEEGVSGRRE